MVTMLKKHAIATKKAEDVEIISIEQARSAFATEFDRATTLTDDQIETLFAEQPDPVMSSKFVQLMKLGEQAAAPEEPATDEAKAKAKAKSVAVRNADAMALGQKLGANADFTFALHESIETEKKKRRNTAAVAFALSQVLSEKELGTYPIPGLSKEDAQKLGSNVKWDVRPMSEGGGSYWGDTFDGTPDGIEIAGRLAKVQAAIDGTVDAPKEYAKEDGDYLKKLKGSIQAERTSGVRVLKSAVNALLRMNEVRGETELGCEFITRKVDGKNVLVPNTDITVLVYYSEESGKDKDGNTIRDRVRSWWTLGKFMSVKMENVTDKATAAEQFAAFKPTRAVGEPDDTNDKDLKNYKQLAAVIPAAFWVLDDAEERTQFIRFLRSDPGKETLAKLVKFNRQLNIILENPVMRELSSKLEAEAAEAATG